MYAKDKYDKQKYFDKYGKYKGQLYDGKFYNPIGKLQWTITRDGKIYDPYGHIRVKSRNNPKKECNKINDLQSYPNFFSILC